MNNDITVGLENDRSCVRVCVRACVCVCVRICVSVCVREDMWLYVCAFGHLNFVIMKHIYELMYYCLWLGKSNNN